MGIDLTDDANWLNEEAGPLALSERYGNLYYKLWVREPLVPDVAQYLEEQDATGRKEPQLMAREILYTMSDEELDQAYVDSGVTIDMENTDIDRVLDEVKYGAATTIVDTYLSDQ